MIFREKEKRQEKNQIAREAVGTQKRPLTYTVKASNSNPDREKREIPTEEGNQGISMPQQKNRKSVKGTEDFRCGPNNEFVNE